MTDEQRGIYNKVIERAERGLPADRWIIGVKEHRLLVSAMVCVARERDALVDFCEAAIKAGSND